MKVVLDTNVLVAGIFFSGPPAAILRAWREGRFTLMVSPPIMEEYRRVMHELASDFPSVDPAPPLELLAIHARMVYAPPLPETVCTDPTDDMFLACAIACNSQVVVSGDKALLRISGYRGVNVITPRAFLSSL
ncbi:MAG: putative toxin-antitoxin system toxin component, PIN family [Kiritimatiellia bacterium]|jgi:putative PIN family toxin of toxin-antitoxin system